jgi:hypothetical protein
MSSRCGQKRAVRLEVQHLGDLADTGGHPGEIGGEFESLRLVAAIFDAVGVGDGLSELAVPGTQFGELLLEALTGLVWVPRTVSRPPVGAFAASRSRSHSLSAAQRGRSRGLVAVRSGRRSQGCGDPRGWYDVAVLRRHNPRPIMTVLGRSRGDAGR